MTAVTPPVEIMDTTLINAIDLENFQNGRPLKHAQTDVPEYLGVNVPND